MAASLSRRACLAAWRSSLVFLAGPGLAVGLEAAVGVDVGAVASAFLCRWRLVGLGVGEDVVASVGLGTGD